ncbi:MAG TPA: MgtC/SapB family protein [Polyangiaceae bacterium]|nr:MgtC/SapB family protein [Polyangiaceae bacterium]
MTEAFHPLSWAELSHAAARLLVAALLGGAIGAERQFHRHAAGLRTHILVTLGAAAFVVTGLDLAGTDHGDPLRVVQGVVIGVGFLGTGTILKPGPREPVRGLTTAAGIWNAAAVGVAVGAGYLGVALALTAITLAVLGLLRALERLIPPTSAEGRSGRSAHRSRRKPPADTAT